MKKSRLQTMWRHICRRGTWVYLGLEVEECPVCGKGKKRVSDAGKEEADDQRATG